VIAEHQPKTMSIFDEFEQKGFDRGFEKGIKKGNKIVELLLEGASAYKIAKSVDLPVEQIESIIANFKSS
jgi:predicted transposase YdaD